jgi:hypothetical protein
VSGSSRRGGGTLKVGRGGCTSGLREWVVLGGSGSGGLL